VGEWGACVATSVCVCLCKPFFLGKSTLDVICHVYFFLAWGGVILSLLLDWLCGNR
jgi:hypothetical protein